MIIILNLGNFRPSCFIKIKRELQANICYLDSDDIHVTWIVMRFILLGGIGCVIRQLFKL